MGGSARGREWAQDPSLRLDLNPCPQSSQLYMAARNCPSDLLVQFQVVPWGAGTLLVIREYKSPYSKCITTAS